MTLTRNRPRGVSFQLASAKTTIVLVIGLLTCVGCASFNERASLPWSKSPAVDGARLAAHQAQLMEQAGHSAECQGKIDEAIRLYEQARTLNPGMDHLGRQLAMLYDQKGDESQAQTAYEQALARTPDDADLQNDVGMYHLRRSRHAEAEVCFRRALQRQPAHARARNNLGISLAMQGRLPESFAAFSEISGPAAAYSNLGVVLMRQGKTDLARDHFRRSLEEDPSLIQATTLLAQLDRAPPTIAASHGNFPVRPVGYDSEPR
jgi:Tfp pilus assembly protein PilF